MIVPTGTVMGCMLTPQINDHNRKLQLDENNTIQINCWLGDFFLWALETIVKVVGIKDREIFRIQKPTL